MDKEKFEAIKKHPILSATLHLENQAATLRMTNAGMPEAQIVSWLVCPERVDRLFDENC